MQTTGAHFLHTLLLAKERNFVFLFLSFLFHWLSRIPTLKDCCHIWHSCRLGFLPFWVWSELSWVLGRGKKALRSLSVLFLWGNKKPFVKGLRFSLPFCQFPRAGSEIFIADWTWEWNKTSLDGRQFPGLTKPKIPSFKLILSKSRLSDGTEHPLE